jgi:hypothetical protein
LGKTFLNRSLIIALFVIPPSLDVDLPRIAAVDREAKLIYVFKALFISVPIQLLWNSQVLIALEISWVPIMASNFSRETSELLILSEDLGPELFVFLVICFRIVRINGVESFLTSFKDLVGEVEEDFKKHCQMPVIVCEVKSRMLATGGV